ncbi:MAG: type VI secretion system tip protein VgrG [Deltaproteobacteria bacterium]|nr:type VI secretion system tip protein VgrG [Deltaproteobacteria bacterium]
MALEPNALIVRRMDGVEAISRLFEIELLLQTAQAEDLAEDEIDSMLASSAYVAFGSAREHRMWGALRSIQMLSVATGNEHVLYRAFFVPRVWTLTLTCKSRVHLDKRVPQIVGTVFTQSGMAEDREHTFALTAPSSQGAGSASAPAGAQAYPVRPYTVQYQETDFAFVSRLLEDEGISFYFDHGEDGDRLVMVDANTSFPELPDPSSVQYHAGGSISGGAEIVTSLSRQQQMVPKRMSLREHDWRQPRLVLGGAFEIDAQGRGEHIRFGDHYATGLEGQRLARIRGEEIQTGKVVFHGRSTIPGLRAGRRFTLHGHPMPELDGMELLVTRVEHHVVQPAPGGVEAEPYENDFEAIPASQPWRPARITPKPKIHGVMTATIFGDRPGTAAPLDADGSYLVQLPFDPEPSVQGPTSTRIRMLQSFAGNRHGVHLPLHIGTEVMIAHVDGDPDRPVIVGAVPNRETMSPVTSENPATESVVQSRAGVHISIEDDA